MMMMKTALLSTFLCAAVVQGFVAPSHFAMPSSRTVAGAVPSQQLEAAKKGPHGQQLHDPSTAPVVDFFKSVENAFKSALFVAALALSTTAANPLPAQASDSAKIATCLFKKCQIPLAKCVANPKCLANVICINTCNGKADESGCQIQCGNLWENDVVGEFNKCAVSDMDCVPQKQDDGSYPVPAPEKLVPKYDTKMWNGRWYITAGQNELFDIFPCQVHFFTETKPGTFFGKLNWRIEEPDGEFFTRDALQQFVQDPEQPGHLINHDNEYLHYQDDWYILDFEYDDNPDGIPPFAFVYYRGSNDAWDGYGGAFIYTRAAKLPESLLPRLRTAAAKVNFDFDRDFVVTDNSCQAMDPAQRLKLKEKFAGKVALQSEKQVQSAATRVRGNALNGVKAQQLFVKQEIQEAGKAFDELQKKTTEFESEVVDAGKVSGAVEAVGKAVEDAGQAVKELTSVE